MVIPYAGNGVRRCPGTGKEGLQSYLHKTPEKSEKRPKDPAAISSAHPNILGKSECEERDWPRPPQTIFASIILGFVERRYWSRSVYRSDLLSRPSSPGMKILCKMFHGQKGHFRMIFGAREADTEKSNG
jgi:hypothetical protein